MPRGKNYVNQHKGMALKAASKEAVKELCFYGNACQRKDCIYRHEKSTSSSTASSSMVKSSDPCMAYLSGFCSFTAKTCRKRHPTSDAEVEALLRKYSAIPCRFGINCKTKGCLYQHADDENVTAVVPPPNLPTAYPLLHLPQPYGPGVRKPSGNSKALRRSLMDPNAFPPLGGDAAAATHEATNHSAPPVCLPAANNTHVTPIAAPTPAHPYTYPTYAPNQHAPMSHPPPMGYHYQQQHYDNAPPMAAATTSVPAAVPVTSLESSTSSASWNLKAQEFVPRGLI